MRATARVRAKARVRARLRVLELGLGLSARRAVRVGVEGGEGSERSLARGSPLLRVRGSG